MNNKTDEQTRKTKLSKYKIGVIITLILTISIVVYSIVDDKLTDELFDLSLEGCGADPNAREFYYSELCCAHCRFVYNEYYSYNESISPNHACQCTNGVYVNLDKMLEPEGD